MDKQELLSNLPSVDDMLKSEDGRLWQMKYPRQMVIRAIRLVLNNLRENILAGLAEEIDKESVFDRVAAVVEELSGYSLRTCLNATGVVLHTNLGRSILSKEAIEHVVNIAGGYSNLEYDIESGTRGKRYAHIRGLLSELTGAEDGIIVNNNAAAVLLCLSSLAAGKEVIVSRGELVEIGGSFRIPEVMTAGGAILREVGTTNKTYKSDYEKAINENTALLLKVHQSNFRMIGFTAETPIGDLVSIGRERKLPIMFDCGSGCMIDLKPYGIHNEPSAQEIISSGVDIVTLSGDKLLGGPQAGVILGKRQLIEKIEKNPLLRAVRIDKMTLAAFEATMMLYLDVDNAKIAIPTLSMLLQKPDAIRVRAKRVAAMLKKRVSSDNARFEVMADVSQSGGGALAGIVFETYAIAIKSFRFSVNDLERRLRLGAPPVIARIKDDKLVLDMRTIREADIQPLVKAVCEALI